MIMADESSGKGLEAYEARGVYWGGLTYRGSHGPAPRKMARERDLPSGGIGATELWLRTIAGGGDPLSADWYDREVRRKIELERLSQELAALRAMGAFFEPQGAAVFLGVNCVTCGVLLSEAGVTSADGHLTCNVCGQSAIPGG